MYVYIYICIYIYIYMCICIYKYAGGAAALVGWWPRWPSWREMWVRVRVRFEGALQLLINRYG